MSMVDRTEMMDEMMIPKGFVPSISVTDLWMKTLENVSKDLVRRSIMECSRRHGFDGEAEFQALGLENLTLIRKSMNRKPKVPREQKVRKLKEPKAEKVREIPLPFNAEEVYGNGCQGLTYNHGLFTQCTKDPMENNEFCASCHSQCSKNASGLPDCGTVEQRMAVDPYEFKDSKGRSPIRYYKLLEKMKVSPEKVSELELIIDPIHFEKVEKTKKAGRPKKVTEAIVTENVTDLFHALTDPVFEEEKEAEAEKVVKQPKKGKKTNVTEATATEIALLEVEGTMETMATETIGTYHNTPHLIATETIATETIATETKEKKKGKISEEDKEAKKAQVEEERAIKKAEQEAKKAAEKAEKEAKKAAEKEAKKAAEKAEKEAKKAAEKEAKKAAEKKNSKAVEPVVEVPKAAVAKAAVAIEEEEQTLVVHRKQINGKMYLMSTDNVLYDATTEEEVGIWDEITKTIIELPEDDDDEEEDEEGYETD